MSRTPRTPKGYRGFGPPGKVLIGTASWTDKTLIASGKFYPKEARTAEARLRYYAENFPIVEVDSTYYYPPTERNAALWIERTPSHFTFHVKAYSLLTKHPTRPDSLYKDMRESFEVPSGKRFVYADKLPAEVVEEIWHRFAEALLPLHSSGKLGVVHFQFPDWFFPTSESRDYIVECRDRLPDYGIAVEFRHGSWLNEKNRERTLDFLNAQKIPFTSVDMPQGFRSSLPPLAVSTASNLAYVRFHGRNRQNWEKSSEIATPRFQYLYKEAELKDWVPKIRSLAKETKEVHVLMNNCYQDYAVRNARQLAALLE